MKNDFYLSIMKDLNAKLKVIADTSMPSLLDYITEGTVKNTDINNRVACLLSKIGLKDLGIDEDEEAQTDLLPAEIVKISECIGELFEDLQIDYDAID